jgi:hypothetical protein
MRHGMCIWDNPEAFRGQANHAINSNLFLVTAVLPGARIDIIRGKVTSCTYAACHDLGPLPVYVVAWMTPVGKLSNDDK